MFYLQALITGPHLNAWALGSVVKYMNLERVQSFFHSRINRQIADSHDSLLGWQKPKKTEILGYWEKRKRAVAYWKRNVFRGINGEKKKTVKEWEVSFWFCFGRITVQSLCIWIYNYDSRIDIECGFCFSQESLLGLGVYSQSFDIHVFL